SDCCVVFSRRPPPSTLFPYTTLFRSRLPPTGCRRRGSGPERRFRRFFPFHVGLDRKYPGGRGEAGRRSAAVGLRSQRETPRRSSRARRVRRARAVGSPLVFLVLVDGDGADVPHQHLLDVGGVLLVLALEAEGVVAELGAEVLGDPLPAGALGVLEL